MVVGSSVVGCFGLVLVTPSLLRWVLVTPAGVFYFSEIAFFIRSFATALLLPGSLVKSSNSSGSWLRLILIVSLTTFSASQRVLLGWSAIDFDPLLWYYEWARAATDCNGHGSTTVAMWRLAASFVGGGHFFFIMSMIPKMTTANNVSSARFSLIVIVPPPAALVFGGEPFRPCLALIYHGSPHIVKPFFQLFFLLFFSPFSFQFINSFFHRCMPFPRPDPAAGMGFFHALELSKIRWPVICIDTY